MAADDAKPSTGADNEELPPTIDPAEVEPAPTERVANIGPFRLLGVLGEGGMGTVYRAEQRHPRRTVALKVIKPALLSQDLLRRFDREAEVLGRLQHPGIAQIYDAGMAKTPQGPQPFFAMEYVADAQVLTAYADAAALGTTQRLDLMACICDGVHHAHQRGVIHRDLKPGNILVDAAGQPKILDFGVARATDSDVQATMHTDVGQLVGTLSYMSPEQIQAVSGHALLYEPRADPGRPAGAGYAERCVQLGRHPLRVARRTTAIRRESTEPN